MKWLWILAGGNRSATTGNSTPRPALTAQRSQISKASATVSRWITTAIWFFGGGAALTAG